MSISEAQTGSGMKTDHERTLTASHTVTVRLWEIMATIQEEADSR